MHNRKQWSIVTVGTTVIFASWTLRPKIILSVNSYFVSLIENNKPLRGGRIGAGAGPTLGPVYKME